MGTYIFEAVPIHMVRTVDDVANALGPFFVGYRLVLRCGNRLPLSQTYACYLVASLVVLNIYLPQYKFYQML